MTKDPTTDPKASLLAEAARVFSARFGAGPSALAFAPGRVEVLGNHTDYNGGYVLALALDRGIAIAARRLAAGEARLDAFSARLGTAVDVPIDSPDPYTGAPWAAYPRGVLLEAARAGAPRFGVQAAIVDDLPVGAGVSSSAALEVATLEAYLALARIEPWDALERARLCQRAECDFVGVPCGLLDQFSAVFGRADHLLFLDCQTLEHAVAPLPETLRVVVADSGTRHALVDGRYAELRRSCEQAARALEELLETPVPDLRAVALERFLELASRIPPAPRRRAEHVLRENARVLAGRAAVERGDLEELGRLMLASHASSRDLLGNSSPELDVLVEEASRLPGFLGGKLTGGGFGGATVNLVAPASAAAFSPALAARYHARTGRDARLLESGIGDGARRFVL